MLANIDNIARGIVTTTPEEMDEIITRLIAHRVTVSVYRKIYHDGVISEETFKRIVRQSAKDNGFGVHSIFYGVY